MENDKVIAPGMFRIDPRKTSREDKFVPINKVRASVRTNPITVSQPHVITKKDVNSDANGYLNLFMMRRLGLFQAYDRESKASHQFRLEVFGNYLEVAFRRNTCFIRNLEGVDLLKGNRTTNLYTINLHEMASASPICLMARATSTKSWLWHQ
ncbi:hypothetical protein Tco_1281687 [Tanacetum coccineum]